MSHSERERYRQQFSVQGAPTWIVFRANGEYVCTSEGGFTSEANGRKLAQVLSQTIASQSADASLKPRTCM